MIYNWWGGCLGLQLHLTVFLVLVAHRVTSVEGMSFMAGLFGSRLLCSGHPGVLGFPLSFLFFCFFCCLFLDCRVPVLVLAGCSHSGWGIILVPASLHFDIILTLMFQPWVLCLTSRLWFSCVFPSYQPVSLHFGLCPLACCTQCPPLQGGGLQLIYKAQQGDMAAHQSLFSFPNGPVC